MANPIDLSTQRFGRLVAIELATEIPPGRGRHWVCRCDCGNNKIATTEQLRSGLQSCGCLSREITQQIGLANRGRYEGENNPNWRGGTSGKGVCANCGNPTYHTSALLCKSCYTSNLTGENNPYWGKFTSENRSAGWDRALRRKELGVCERCQTKPATDRHHKDDNPLNNSPENIMALCRRCHMIVDDRLAKLHRRR